MTGEQSSWPVRLAAAAEDDFHSIVRWSARQFGATQAQSYAQTLAAAITSLAQGPTATGVRVRNNIARGLFTLHVARKGRKGRHFVMFRITGGRGAETIEVLRLLHDAMDLPRHLSPGQE